MILKEICSSHCHHHSHRCFCLFSLLPYASYSQNHKLFHTLIPCFYYSRICHTSKTSLIWCRLLPRGFCLQLKTSFSKQSSSSEMYCSRRKLQIHCASRFPASCLIDSLLASSSSRCCYSLLFLFSSLDWHCCSFPKSKKSLAHFLLQAKWSSYSSNSIVVLLEFN